MAKVAELSEVEHGIRLVEILPAEEENRVIVRITGNSIQSLQGFEVKKEIERMVRRGNYTFRGIDPTSTVIYPVDEKGEATSSPAQKFVGYNADYLVYV